MPTGDFAGRVPRFRLLLTLAMALALLATGLAVVSPAQADEHESEEWEQVKGVIDLICLNPQSAGAVNDVNDTAPADLGQCEDEVFFFGEDLKPVEDEAAALVGTLIDELPEDPEDVERAVMMNVPPTMNCGGYEDVENWTNQMIGDANCNGWSNIEELEEGCDPLDPTTSPNTPDRCNLIPAEDPDQLEPWVASWLPPVLNCAGHEEALDVIDQLIGNADCNDYSNIEELKGRCNPLNPLSYPGSPFPGACVPEPDQGDPEESANQTVLWAQMQATSAQGAAFGALPFWLAGIVGWLLNHPGIPEPPE